MGISSVATAPAPPVAVEFFDWLVVALVGLLDLFVVIVLFLVLVVVVVSSAIVIVIVIIVFV
jgi:hypothetical protein